jgi:hypothetical protein
VQAPKIGFITDHHASFQNGCFATLQRKLAVVAAFMFLASDVRSIGMPLPDQSSHLVRVGACRQNLFPKLIDLSAKKSHLMG